MSDKYIDNIGCEECGSKDAVGVYQRDDGEFYGNCFSCNKYVVDPYKNNQEVLSKEEEEDKIIAEPSYNKLVTRGISKEVCEQYSVKSCLDTNGSDVYHYYPHYSKSGDKSVCERHVPTKKFRWINGSKDLQFFGQQLAGSGGKMIIVTEGVCDCLAAKEMLLACGKNYRVVSIVNGAQAALKDFKNNFEWINSFENIFLAFDQDEPGQKASVAVSNLFPPNKVKNITFSEKDPNELLLSGKSQEFLTAIFSAREGRPTGIVSVEDIYQDAIKPPVYGLSFPWKTLTDVTYGYRTGELWGVGAGSGCGKTEFFKEMINHTIYHHKGVAGVIFLEEPVAKTLKVLAGKKVNKRFHIPQDRGGDWTIEELVDGINDLRGKVYLYNHFGSKDWESIKSKIRFMVMSLGVKDVYIDHLTALVAQEDNEYKALNRLMEEMSSLCQELDCTIFYISHLRKSGSTPHEEGGRVTADQFKGSGAIVFWSNFLIGLERNQQADDEEERNTTTLRVLKDRNTGLATGTTFKLKYNHNTGRWVEVSIDEFDEV
ncbi:DNA directed DNA polymerase [Caudoviricetes sp.]|nr:DNA directed DNA polymerase [Caudoviricetes sp.]